MARTFNGTSSEVTVTCQSEIATLTAASLSAWFFRSSTSHHVFAGWGTNSNRSFNFLWFSDGKVYFQVEDGSFAYGSVNLTGTGWNHISMTFNGGGVGNSNRILGYINGTQQTLSFSGTAPAALPSSVNLSDMKIGRQVITTRWSTGRIAEVGVWNSTLSAASHRSLSKAAKPSRVNPQSLVAYIPMIRSVIDVRKAATIVDTNTTSGKHPRIF